MIVKDTTEKVYYPKRKIDDLVLSLEYKYSDCHSNNEIYFYQSKHTFSKDTNYDLYFEARNRKTSLIEACILGYTTKYEGFFVYYQIRSVIIDKLSFSSVEALMKLLHYMESIYYVIINFPTLVITDLDDDLKRFINGKTTIVDLHERYNQKFYYVDDEAFNLSVYGIFFNADDDYTYEDKRAIFLDNDFTLFNKYDADDTFYVQEEGIWWDVPMYKFSDETDGDLVYLNEEQPVGFVRFNKLFYKNKVVGYYVYDIGLDKVEDKFVMVTYIYDMYIDSKDDFKYKVLNYILNYIKFNTYKWLPSYFVMYKLNDGKDAVCNCLIDRFNAIDDGDKVYIKYEQK